MASKATPEVIHGGCLCESIRYKITFPPGHDFSKSSATCQCSQCRKQTGTLVFYAFFVPLTALTWLSDSTLERYQATSDCARGFCKKCGSYLFWQRLDGDVINLAMGSFDKDVLMEYGEVLADAKCHVWCGDQIKGVTDYLKGERFRLDSIGDGVERMD